MAGGLLSDDHHQFILSNLCPCGESSCFISREGSEDYSRTNPNGSEVANEEFDRYVVQFEKDLPVMIPFIGQSFISDEEAYNFYFEFAKGRGFSVRRERSLGGINHPLGFYRREYVCHRAGLTRSKKVLEVERQRDRKSTRCDCKAKLMIFKDIVDGIVRWKITEFSDIHNHEMLKGNEVRFLPAYRNIDIIDRERIATLSKAGCSIKLIMRVLELEKGIEPGCLSFTERDLRNYLQSRISFSRENDALEILKLCKVLKEQDIDFCYDFTIDKDNKLEHIIWSFGDSVRAYESFGDVVVFDTTYRINCYDMPLGVWVGINNHGNSIFLGCVLLHDEKFTSFRWAMKKFLLFMGEKCPQTILTDQDLALTEAIAVELPNTKHAFCIWHIAAKLPGWFSSVLGIRFNEFKSEFYRLYNLETSESFEQQWYDMVSYLGLNVDRHISLLYAHRKCWALPYLRDYFFAGMTTTGRSESINSFLKKYLNARTCLKDFMQEVGVAVSTRNNTGEEATMRQKYYNPIIKTCMPIEEHASTILTPYAFQLLQEEMVLSAQYAVEEIDSTLYIVRHCKKEEGGRHVSWIPEYEDIRCSCKEFEFAGILCRHAIRVLVVNNYFCLLDKYLPIRWRRESSQVFHFTQNIRHPSDSSIDSERQPLRDLSNETCIRNPMRSITKGRPKTRRLVGGVEATKKARHCHVPNCGGVGHDSRNCPMKRKSNDLPSVQSPNKL